MAMTFQECLDYIRSDLYRLNGDLSVKSFLKYFLAEPGFKYLVVMRLCRYLNQKKLLLPLYLVAWFIFRQLRYRYGIAISFRTDIGHGFYIGHFGGIVVNRQVKIGNNCNISQGVTLAQANRGKHEGCPTIGDRVYIGPGAKIFGSIKIGNDVAIGANCVVTDDVPDHAVVVGVPGKVISMKGSVGYVNNVWPPGSPVLSDSLTDRITQS